MFRRSKRNCEPDTVRRARATAEHAAAERLRIEAQAEEAMQIGASIRRALERNHFGESIQSALSRRGMT